MGLLKYPSFLLPLAILLLGNDIIGQGALIEVKGIVYDITQRNPMEGVSVLATNGKGTSTDAMGRYTIMASESDSIFFSYQNKVTGKYPVIGLQDPRQFNMALHIQINTLPPVTIYGKSYRMDSIANRMEYGKYFNYSKPNPLKNINMSNGAVGMDPNDIINLFRFRRNRQLASLQARLLQEEQDKYVDFRFTKKFVKKVTNLPDEDVTKFMHKYRPPYDFVAIVNELELGYYIQQCYKKEMGLLPKGTNIYLLGIDPLPRAANTP